MYHLEEGTVQLELFLEKEPIQSICLAEITQVEFVSVVFRKLRMKEIDEHQAKLLVSGFHADFSKFQFVTDGLVIKSIACELLESNWKDGLRTLDAIQLASAKSILSDTDYFHSSDSLLNKIATKENLRVVPVRY
jgi:predicted nucleic acid-binding protein